MTNKKTSSQQSAKQDDAPLHIDDMDHVDLMKLIYGGCGSCPSAGGCGSADLDEDGNPTDHPEEKSKKKK